jgi:hypothetical protein
MNDSWLTIGKFTALNIYAYRCITYTCGGFHENIPESHWTGSLSIPSLSPELEEGLERFYGDIRLSSGQLKEAIRADTNKTEW